MSFIGRKEEGEKRWFINHPQETWMKGRLYCHFTDREGIPHSPHSPHLPITSLVKKSKVRVLLLKMFWTRSSLPKSILWVAFFCVVWWPVPLCVYLFLWYPKEWLFSFFFIFARSKKNKKKRMSLQKTLECEIGRGSFFFESRRRV